MRLILCCVLVFANYLAYFLHSIWRDASRVDVVVEIDGVEPRLHVFASLGVLPNVFGKKGQSFAITFRSPLFHVTGPLFRATGITNYLENGGTLEVAQRWLSQPSRAPGEDP